MYFKPKDLILNIKQHPLEYITLVLAVMGSILTSGTSDINRCYGFILWIASNGYMLIGFLRSHNIPYIILFVIYEIANIRGAIVNWS